MERSKPDRFNGFIPLFSDHSFQPLKAPAAEMRGSEGIFQPFEVSKKAAVANNLYLEARSVLAS